MRRLYVCTALILGGCTLAGSAQTGPTSAKGAGTQMSPVQAQDELLNLFEHEFMGVAQAMPADKYGFAPAAATFTTSQGAKYDGVRTFAQEISHVTLANYYFASKILGQKMPVDPKKAATAAPIDKPSSLQAGGTSTGTSRAASRAELAGQLRAAPPESTTAW